MKFAAYTVAIMSVLNGMVLGYSIQRSVHIMRALKELLVQFFGVYAPLVITGIGANYCVVAVSHFMGMYQWMIIAVYLAAFITFFERAGSVP
jgi:hypothetical protein